MSREVAKEKPADVGTALAHERTDLAVTRTRLASVLKAHVTTFRKYPSKNTWLGQ